MCRFIFDADSGTLELKVNDNDFGVIFSDVPSGVCPAVTSYSSGREVSVRLLSVACSLDFDEMDSVPRCGPLSGPQCYACTGLSIGTMGYRCFRREERGLVCAERGEGVEKDNAESEAVMNRMKQSESKSEREKEFYYQDTAGGREGLKGLNFTEHQHEFLKLKELIRTLLRSCHRACFRLRSVLALSCGSASTSTTQTRILTPTHHSTDLQFTSHQSRMSGDLQLVGQNIDDSTLLSSSSALDESHLQSQSQSDAVEALETIFGCAAEAVPSQWAKPLGASTILTSLTNSLQQLAGADGGSSLQSLFSFENTENSFDARTANFGGMAGVEGGAYEALVKIAFRQYK